MTVSKLSDMSLGMMVAREIMVDGVHRLFVMVSLCAL